MARHAMTPESEHRRRPLEGQAHRTLCALKNVAGELLQIELEKLARDAEGGDARPITADDVYNAWFRAVAPRLADDTAVRGVVKRYLEALSDAS